MGFDANNLTAAIDAIKGVVEYFAELRSIPIPSIPGESSDPKEQMAALQQFAVEAGRFMQHLADSNVPAVADIEDLRVAFAQIDAELNRTRPGNVNIDGAEVSVTDNGINIILPKPDEPDGDVIIPDEAEWGLPKTEPTSSATATITLRPCDEDGTEDTAADDVVVYIRNDRDDVQLGPRGWTTSTILSFVRFPANVGSDPAVVGVLVGEAPMGGVGVFPVYAEKDGGQAGDDENTCELTYSVYKLDKTTLMKKTIGGEVDAEHMPVEKQRLENVMYVDPSGKNLALAFYDEDGDLILWDANEIHYAPEEC